MTRQRASQGLGSVPGVARKTLVNTSSLGDLTGETTVSLTSIRGAHPRLGNGGGRFNVWGPMQGIEDVTLRASAAVRRSAVNFISPH
jgi:hypothetical protein